MVGVESKIQELVSESKIQEAKNLLREVVSKAKRADEMSFAVRQFKKIESLRAGMRPVRLAFLRSFTMDLFFSPLTAKMMANDWLPEFYQGDFNVFHQEVYDPLSALYRHEPDFLIIAADGRDLSPKLYDSFLSLSREDVEKEVQGVISFYKNLVTAFRKKSKASVLIHPFLLPTNGALGIIDEQNPLGQRQVIASLNRSLREWCSTEAGVFVLGLEACVEDVGAGNWYNQRMWYLARIPYTVEAVFAIVDIYVRFIYAVLGCTKKCLVLDLDNTLWGGVIGETGDIKLGPDYPGRAFVDFQGKILNLYNRGVILAINSKNSFDIAIEAIENHPHMLLRSRHFAGMKINWENKVQNIKELASEINIGLDSMVFVDDSPFECELVRTELPEVSVIELPKEPEKYSSVIDDAIFFSSISFSAEDKKRGELYRIRKKQQELMDTSESLDSFFASLEMRLSITKDPEKLIPRISQMCQKTNQFNLTTKRYTENDIADFVKSKDKDVYALSLKDKFGDNGVIGVCIVFRGEKEHKIDTMLISCRVIGRKIESALLNFIFANANCKKIVGEYLPTQKNKQVKDLFTSHGFSPVASGGGRYFELDSKEYKPKDVSFIEVITCL